jgi:hypothetical protein
MTEVEYALTREGFELAHVHMQSASLRKDLTALMNNSDDESTV